MSSPSGPALFGAGRRDAAGCPASGRAAAPARFAGPQVHMCIRGDTCRSLLTVGHVCVCFGWEVCV